MKRDFEAFFKKGYARSPFCIQMQDTGDIKVTVDAWPAGILGTVTDGARVSQFERFSGAFVDLRDCIAAQEKELELLRGKETQERAASREKLIAYLKDIPNQLKSWPRKETP